MATLDITKKIALKDYSDLVAKAKVDWENSKAKTKGEPIYYELFERELK